MKTFAIQYTINGRTIITVWRAKTAEIAVKQIERAKKIRLCNPLISIL